MFSRSTVSSAGNSAVEVFDLDEVHGGFVPGLRPNVADRGGTAPDQDGLARLRDS